MKKIMLVGDDGVEQELGAVVGEELKSQLIEMGLEMKDGKVAISALPAEVKEEVDARVKRAEVSSNFIKANVLPENQHEKHEVKAVTTETTSMGYAMPTELATAILEKKEQASKIRRRAFVFQMAGNFDLPVENVAVTGYWVGDNVEITGSDPTLAKKSFVDNWVAARVLVPWQLMNATPIAIESYIASLFGRKLVRAEEEKFIGGDGTGEPLGIRDAGSSITGIAQAAAALDITDLKKLYFALPEQYREGASFLTSSNGRMVIDGLTDDNGRPLFPIEKIVDVVFGKALEESDHIPANLGAGTNETEVYFGDFSYYHIKEGTALSMESDKIISKLQTELVAYQAVDGGVTLSDAFRKLTAVK